MKRRKRSRKRSTVRFASRKRRATRSRRVARKTRRVRRTVARRSTRRRSSRRRSVAVVARRSTRRRSSRRRRSSGRRMVRRSGGGLRGGIKGFINKEMLLTAGGAIASTLLTNWILGHFGPNKIVTNSAGQSTIVAKSAAEFVLPGLRPGADGKQNTIAVIAYAAGIPLAGAMAVRKINPTLAKGLAIGGLISGLSQIVVMAMAKTKTVANALPAAAVKPPGEFFRRKQLQVGYQTPSAMNTVGANPYNSENAFKSAAFGN